MYVYTDGRIRVATTGTAFDDSSRCSKNGFQKIKNKLVACGYNYYSYDSANRFGYYRPAASDMKGGIKRHPNAIPPTGLKKPGSGDLFTKPRTVVTKAVNAITGATVVIDTTKKVDDKFGYYQGHGEWNAHGRLSRGKVYLDVATDVAEILPIVTDAGLRFRAANSKSDVFESDPSTSWGTQALLAGKLLTEIKLNKTILKINPRLTTSDVTPGLPLNRASMRGLEIQIQDMAFPKLAYAIAELFTQVIQIGGEESQSSIQGEYFMPFIPYNDLAELDALIISIEDEYDSGAFAKQMGVPLVKYNKNWSEALRVVPYFSDYAIETCRSLPMKVNDGGVVETRITLGAATVADIRYTTACGFGEIQTARNIFHSTTDTYGWSTIVSPAADKVSVDALAADAKTFVEVDKDDEDYDFLQQLALGMSREPKSIVSEGFPMAQKYAGLCTGIAASARLLSTYFSNHIKNTRLEVWAMKRKLVPDSSLGEVKKSSFSHADASQYGSLASAFK